MSVDNTEKVAEAVNDDDNDEFHMLITRSNQHKRSSEKNQSSSSGTTTSVKRRKSNVLFIMCKEHAKSDKKWTVTNDQCDICIKFQNSTQLPNGRLPLLKQVICFTLEADMNEVVMDLMLHWINCNVSTQSRKTIAEKLKKYKQELSDLQRYPKTKRGETYWKRVSTFVTDCNKLFDIKGSPGRIKGQEQLWNVRMTETDFEFYRNQCLTPQVGYCCTSIDKRWSKSQKRKAFDNFILERSRESNKVSKICLRT